MSLVLDKAHRRELNVLTDLARKDLSTLWGEVGSAESARDALMDVLPKLVDVYGSAASTLAADYYDEARDAAGVRGKFRAIPSELTDPKSTETLARWAVSPLFQENPDPAAALSLASGGMQRSIANGSRLTIVESSLQDPQSEGWMRVGAGECDWCSQFLDGEVHYTEGYDFEAHNNCHCTAVSVFSGQSPTDVLDGSQDGAEDVQASDSAAAEPLQVAQPVELVSGITPDDLMSALDPSRKRTAAAVKAELEATPAGKDLAAVLKSFTETRGGVANLRTNIEKVLDGSTTGPAAKRTRSFLDAMNSYPTEKVPTLFRGFAVKVEDTNAWWDSFEAQFKPGTKFDLNASSFTSSEKKAAEFGRMIGGTKRAGSNHTAVRYVLEDNPHALPVEQLSKFKAEKEWMSGGEFEVVDYTPASKSQPYYRVVIRQVKSLKAPK